MITGNWLIQSRYNKILVFDFDTNFKESDLIFPGDLDRMLEKSKESLIAQLGLTTEQKKEVIKQIYPLYHTKSLLEIVASEYPRIITKAIKKQ